MKNSVKQNALLEKNLLNNDLLQASAWNSQGWSFCFALLFGYYLEEGQFKNEVKPCF
jgi:hypothetical protein